MSFESGFGNRLSDLRYGWRMICRTPGASAMAVLSLALGIGANTAIFSLVDTVLLKLLPVRSPQELYMVGTFGGFGRGRGPNVSWNYPDYAAFRDHNRSFTGLAMASLGLMALGVQVAGSDASAAAELTQATLVSGNYFQVLGVEPALGRLFNPEQDRAFGASPYAVLSYDYWRARFGSSPAVIGQKLRVNGYPFTVIGVARRGFRSTDVSIGPDLYLPSTMRSEVTGMPVTRWNTRHMYWLAAVGRIRPGVSLKQAEGDLYAIDKSQEESERRTVSDPRFVNKASPIKLLPAARGYSFVRNRLERPLIAVMVLVGLVLLIACANVANLMLARGAARAREIAVRLAVGASRASLAGQLVTESLMLALLGGAAGLAFAYGGVTVLLTFLPQTSFTTASLAVRPDLRLFGFAVVVSLLAGLVFGVAPAFASTRPVLVTALKEDTPGAGSSRFTLRNGLVVTQVALSLVLVIGAGLFMRSIQGLGEVQAGFSRAHVVYVFVDPTMNGYKGQSARDFYQRLLGAVERLPGVRSASLAAITPLAGSRWNDSFVPEGYQFKPSEKKYVDMNAVGPRYFETVGIALLQGREFRDDDNPAVTQAPPDVLRPGFRPEAPGPRVAIVNESFATHYYAGRNPIGLHIARDEKYDPAHAYEIVGVVKDAHYFGLREATEPMIYVPIWREPGGGNVLAIRTAGPTAGLVDAVRRQVTATDPAVPMLTARTIEQQIDNNILEDRLLMTLTGFFGSLALLLAAVGLYGVISYTVTRRTREIGIRMALGAERGSVVWLVARYALGLVLFGGAIGLPAAFGLTRLVLSFLFGVNPQEAGTMLAGSLALVLVAGLASLAPTLRATQVDPMVALRHD
jgi:predicted permease